MDVSLVQDDDQMAEDAANLVGAIGHEGDYRDSSSSEGSDESSSEEEEEGSDDEDEMYDDEDPKDKKIRKLERRLKTALQKSRRRKITIERLQKTTEKEVMTFLKQHYPASWCNWLLGRRKRPTKQWGHEEICKCLILRKKIGTKNYNFMRKEQMMPLPSVRTLRRRIAHFRVDLGSFLV